VDEGEDVFDGWRSGLVVFYLGAVSVSVEDDGMGKVIGDLSAVFWRSACDQVVE
jgi:hypothetical protein